MEADRPRQQRVGARDAGIFLVRTQRRRLVLGLLQQTVGNGDQATVVERRVGKADQRLVTAAVVPRQQRGGQVARGLVQQAVRIEIDRDALALLFHDDLVVALGTAGREETCRR
ncbi:hypothetical protein D3C86_1660140 [compost metagenome]